MDKVREEFEAFAEERGFDPNYYFARGVHPNYYDHDTVNEMWMSWKASRAALCVELPENCKGMALTVSEFRKRLDKAGVSYK